MAKKEIVEFKDRNYLPITQGVDAIVEQIKEAIGNEALTWRNFERAVNPASGDSEWKMEDLDGTTMRFDEIEGIVVFHKMTRSYWREEYKGGGTPPDCSSEDGLRGIGDPGGDCTTCAFAKFGSGKNNSQACRQVKQIFLLKEGEILPILINLSPINSEKAKTYFLRLLSRKQLAYNQVVTKLVMTADKSSSGYDYGDVKLVMVEPIPSENVSSVKKLSAMFEAHLGDTLEATLGAESTVTSEEFDSEAPDF